MSFSISMQNAFALFRLKRKQRQLYYRNSLIHFALFWEDLKKWRIILFETVQKLDSQCCEPYPFKLCELGSRDSELSWKKKPRLLTRLQHSTEIVSGWFYLLSTFRCLKNSNFYFFFFENNNNNNKRRLRKTRENKTKKWELSRALYFCNKMKGKGKRKEERGVQLEHCVLFWSPRFHKDAYRLERVQRRIMKMIKDLKNLSFEERLKELVLSSMEKGQLGPYHNIPELKGLLQRGWRLSLHKRHKENTKGNRYKLYQERFHLNIRNTFLQ